MHIRPVCGAFGVAGSGSHVYGADQIEGLMIIDVSDAARPERVGGQEVRWWATDVAVSGSARRTQG
jgi:hypothetical protein